MKNPKNAELWLEAIRVERRAGFNEVAAAQMARGEIFVFLFFLEVIEPRILSLF
jgi:hypothetical protein